MSGSNGTSNGNGATAMVVSPLSAFATRLAGPGPSRQLDTDDLARWIRDRSNADQKSRQCVLFSLCHDADDGRGRTAICQFSLGKKEPVELRESIIHGMVEEFSRASVVFAATYPRVQRFFVGAHLRDDVAEPAISEYPFLVDPPPDAGAQHFQSDGPETNLSAVVGHLQRIIDKTVSLQSSNMQAMMDRLVDEKRDLMAHYEKVFEQRWEMAVKCETLLDAHAERTIRVEEARANLEIRGKLYASLANYGFAFLKKYIESKEKTSPEGPIITAVKELAPAEMLSFINVVNALPDDKKEKFAPIIDLVVESWPNDRKMELAVLAQESMTDAQKQSVAEQLAAVEAAKAQMGKKP